MTTEKRLIDANWVLGEIEHDLGCYELGKLTADDAIYADIRDVVRMVCAAPTVDAVEVVRCKDCKHWADGVRGCTEHVKCCKIGFYMVDENGYCVYGERRTDGN